MAPSNRDKLLQIIRIRGPVIPAQIKDVINTDILMASAMLSELVSKNLLKVSSLKIGGSPLYYIPGQESKLQNFANKLNEKDRKTYDLLQQKRILRDKELDPLTRVSLRQIKDFAKPLEVSFGEEKEIFWKWYLTPDQEAGTMIKKVFGIKKELPIPKPESVKEKIKEKKPEILERVKEEVIEKREAIPIKKPPKPLKPPKPKRFVEVPKDTFVRTVNNYFKRKNIQVIEQKVVRKNSDIDYVIKLPTAVGSVMYYCKAKSKKRPSDADLASAFVQGQLKKLPVLFLTPGELTKRAKEMLNKEFKNIIIKKV